MLGGSTASCEGGTNLDVELHDAKATVYRTQNAYDAGGYHKVVIMGAGRLGQSLVPVTCSASPNGIKVVGMFDSDPGKIGLRFPNGVVVESDEYLPARVIQHCVKRGIIAVPAIEAQRAANALVDAGVQVILNYAPVNLSVPGDVQCERVDPAIQFARMRPAKSFFGGLVAPQPSPSSETVSKLQFNTALARTMLCLQYPVVPDLQLQKPVEYESFFSFLVSERKKQESEQRKYAVPQTHVELVEKPRVSVDAKSVDDMPKANPECVEQKDADRLWRVLHRPKLQFDDVAGLTAAKDALIESLGRHEKAFNRLLLYGPPGCGKSMLARAVIGEFFETYACFTVPSADLVTMGRGALRVLFCHATAVGPSIVCIDNLHLISKHKTCKAELLDVLEELSGEHSGVIFIGATNVPWDLDLSLLRHFEQRISVPLPDVKARKELLLKSPQLRDIIEEEGANCCLNPLLQQTKNYSCSDICLILKDALMQPCRRNEDACNATLSDFKKSCCQIRPTISKEIIDLYNSFECKFGQLRYMSSEEHEHMQQQHYAIYS